MFFKKPGLAGAMLTGVAAIGVGLATAQEPGDARRTGPTAPRTGAIQLPPAADLIYKYVKLRKPREYNWQRIPWLVDLPEAIHQAKAENRPILLWISGDEPLGRC